MIQQLRESWAIDPILEMISERKNIFKIPKDKIKNYLLSGIKHKDSIVLIDEKDGNIYGFVFATVEEMNGEDICFIHACIVEPGRKSTVHDFIARLRKWSKERNIEKLFMSTNKHEEGFCRKYGFRYHSTLMTLNVDK